MKRPRKLLEIIQMPIAVLHKKQIQGRVELKGEKLQVGEREPLSESVLKIAFRRCVMRSKIIRSKSAILNLKTKERGSIQIKRLSTKPFKSRTIQKTIKCTRRRKPNKKVLTNK